MTFRKQLELHLDKLLGSTATKQQRADTCGVDYNYYVNIASGSRKPPSDEKILEISRKLKLGDKESVELLALAIQEKIKDQDTRGILDRYFDSDSTPTLKPSLPETFAAPDNLVVLNEEPHKIPIHINQSRKRGNGSNRRRGRRRNFHLRRIQENESIRNEGLWGFHVNRTL